MASCRHAWILCSRLQCRGVGTRTGHLPWFPVQTHQQPHGAQAAAARGKTAKSKKAAAKYADQDDEDRRLAMAILGSAGMSPAQRGRCNRRLCAENMLESAGFGLHSVYSQAFVQCSADQRPQSA